MYEKQDTESNSVSFRYAAVRAGPVAGRLGRLSQLTFVDFQNDSSFTVLFSSRLVCAC
jgi:hypothetical protein